MTKPSTGKLLQNYIEKHEKNVESFAKSIGVGTASVYRWFEEGPRSKAVRIAVEMRTMGRITADMWPDPRNRWTKKSNNHKSSNKKKLTKRTNSKKIMKNSKTKRIAKHSVKPATKRPVAQPVVNIAEKPTQAAPGSTETTVSPTPPAAA